MTDDWGETSKSEEDHGEMMFVVPPTGVICGTDGWIFTCLLFRVN